MTFMWDYGHSHPLDRSRRILHDEKVRTIPLAPWYGKNILIWVALESLEKDVKTILCSVSIDCSLEAILEPIAVVIDQD